MIEILKKAFGKLTSQQAFVDPSIGYDCRIINGSYQVSQCVVAERLKINGSASFGQNTLVQNNIIVNGKLDASKSTFEGDLIVNGTATLSQSVLKNKAQFSGNLAATDCQISHDVNLLAHKASFTHSQINRINVQRLPYVKTAQTIYLRNGSTVTGDISFESGTGEIHLDGSSQIQGEVHGGKIVPI